MFICHLNILPFSHKETKEVLDLMTRAESEYLYYLIVVSVNACLWDADKLPGEKSDRWPEVWHQLIHSKGKTPHLSVCQYNRECTYVCGILGFYAVLQSMFNMPNQRGLPLVTSAVGIQT